MDEQTTPGGRSSLTPSVPWPVWLLLAGAVMQLGVQMAPDSYSVFGPYFLVDAGMVLDWVHAISLFLLAAAVVLAADRWPAGRRMLLLGAAAVAVLALLRMALDIWWAVWEASGHMYEASQPWVLGMHLGAGVVFSAAHVLLAAGLWATRPHPAMGRTRAALVAAIGFGGIVATGAALWVVVQTIALAPADYRAYSISILILTAGGFAAVAALAAAASRVAPQRGRVPETLIAIGAVLGLAGSAWAGSYPYFTPVQEVSQDALFWVFTLPNLGITVGMLLMIAGFGLGAIGIRRAATVARA